MTDLIKDLRHTFRLLVKQPGFTLVVLITLALGIGANTAIFSVVNSLLLKPLPYAQADRLALLWGVETDTKLNYRSQVSATDAADWRTQNSVFEDLTTYGSWSATLTGAGEPERLYGMQVGEGYFSVMRGKPLLGRVFTAEDQIHGKDQVIVLGHDLWKRRFAGDPNIIGQKVRLGGTPYTIVGVMPEAFAPLPKSLVDYRADFYRPVAEKYDDADRSSRHLRAIGRLKPGVIIERAQSELSTIAARLEKAHPTTNSGYGLRVTTLAADTVGGLRSGLLMLLGA
ncbi:MAG: ABC transporter permease, partial [Blastocatellia bacterium]